MDSEYNRLLFEQQTPYLQWLKEQQSEVKYKDIEEGKGKRISLIPFSLCTKEEKASVKQLHFLEQLQTCDIAVFIGENGYPQKGIEDFFAAYFSQNEAAVLAYADEDYLGDLPQKANMAPESIKQEYEEVCGGIRTGRYRCEPWFKPDFSPDTLRSFFYFGNVFAVQMERVRSLKLPQPKSLEYLALYRWVKELAFWKMQAGHLNKVLYTNFSKEDKMQDNPSFYVNNPSEEEDFEGENSKEGTINSDCEKKYTILHNEIKKQRKRDNELTNGLEAEELISIIIPSKDNADMLLRCLNSLLSITSYKNYEVIIVDNGSKSENRLWIKEQLERLQKKHRKRIQYDIEEMDFHFSKMCNIGAALAQGEYLLFLNDDVEVVQEDWLTVMQQQGNIHDTGAVGAKLLYPKKKEEEKLPYRIQHVGITNMGIGPAHKLNGAWDTGSIYHGRNTEVYNVLAVTAACLLVRTEYFKQVKGFDETLPVAYNDVDLCFKLYEAGYYNVQRNDVSLIHYESFSRGQDVSQEKRQRLEREKERLYQLHQQLVGKDPFYSPHLVQWRKDTEYHCNYQYEYERTRTPQALPEIEKKRFPKEHRNRLLRKLTGESACVFQIDTVEEEIRYKKKCITLAGWSLVYHADNQNVKKILIVKHQDTGTCYALPCYPVYRPDVENFVREAKRKQDRQVGKDTKNAALAGFEVHMEIEGLPKGNYEIAMLMRQIPFSCRRWIGQGGALWISSTVTVQI